jgi:glycosyltransferase involved in cell wall biosynthesis
LPAFQWHTLKESSGYAARTFVADGEKMRRPLGSRPIRVLYFDHTAQLSGGEIALRDLVHHLDRTVVTPVILLGSEGPLAEQLRPHAEVHILPMDTEILHARKDDLGGGAVRSFRKSLRSLLYALKLRRFLLQNEIDLIHTNSLKADILGGIAGRLARCPVVWHVRDRIAPDYLPASTVFLFRRLARVLPSYVIANSAATLATLRLSSRFPSTAIGSGVDMSHFPPDPTPAMAIPDQPRRIGLVGRICPWKGQHVFLHAAAEVHRSFPNAHFLIIGAALFQEESYEAELRAFTKSAGLEQVVDFTGFRKDVAQLISSLDILVHASTTGEPFGQVIVQGMAAARPVVATRGGGVPEIVEEGKTGLLVPMGDAQAMAQAIGTLLRAPALAAEMGRQGRQRVLEHFTIQQTARQAEAVYRSVLQPGNH